MTGRLRGDVVESSVVARSRFQPLDVLLDAKYAPSNRPRPVRLGGESIGDIDLARIFARG